MTMDSSISSRITTIEVTPKQPGPGKTSLRFLAPYLIAPIAAAVVVIIVAFAEAFPIAALLVVIFGSALVGPALDIWHHHRHRAEINESLYRDERPR